MQIKLPISLIFIDLHSMYPLNTKWMFVRQQISETPFQSVIGLKILSASTRKTIIQYHIPYFVDTFVMMSLCIVQLARK